MPSDAPETLCLLKDLASLPRSWCGCLPRWLALRNPQEIEANRAAEIPRTGVSVRGNEQPSSKGDEMSNRKRLSRMCLSHLTNDDLSCDVCGAPDNDETRYGVSARADSATDKKKLLAYFYGGMRLEDMPANLRTMMLVRCPGHTDDDILRAGIVPPQMIDQVPGLREALNQLAA